MNKDEMKMIKDMAYDIWSLSAGALYRFCPEDLCDYSCDRHSCVIKLAKELYDEGWRKLGKSTSDDTTNEYFEKTYSIYPRKVSKEQARKTYAHKLVGLDVESARKVANTIYKCLEKQLVVWGNEKDGEGRLQEFLPHFSTWLNDNFADSPHYKRSRKR